MLTKPGLKEPLSCVHQIKFPLLGTRVACACYSADSSGIGIFIHNHLEWSRAGTGVWDPLPMLSSNTSIYSPPQIRPFPCILFSHFQTLAKSHCLRFFLPILLPRVRDQLRYHTYGQHTQDSTEQQPTGPNFSYQEQPWHFSLNLDPSKKPCFFS